MKLRTMEAKHADTVHLANALETKHAEAARPQEAKISASDAYANIVLFQFFYQSLN